MRFACGVACLLLVPHVAADVEAVTVQGCPASSTASSCVAPPPRNAVGSRDNVLMQINHAAISKIVQEERTSAGRDNILMQVNHAGIPLQEKASLGRDQILMQFNHAAISKTVRQEPATESSAESCCVQCAGSDFCSPRSGSCYASKNNEYYTDCNACCSGCAVSGFGFCSPSSSNCYTAKAKEYYRDCSNVSTEPTEPSCCDACEKDIPGFCSPLSGTCYESNNKAYYQDCPNGGLAAPTRRLEKANTSVGSVKLMSYNLFGWNAFNQQEWKSQNILRKIQTWDPDVLGAQEVETGGGQGGHIVSSRVTSATGIAGGDAIGQFFNSSAVVAHETEFISLVRGYWMSMTKYTHKGTGVPFLFFNSHWKHGYGAEQKEIVANAIDAQRKKHGSPPTILVGDTNQFCMAHELEAVKYLKGEEGSSPVVFIDAIAQDKGSSYDGGCRIDFILASEGQWKRVQSSIDREGMGQNGAASDHAALMAELVPIA